MTRTEAEKWFAIHPAPEASNGIPMTAQTSA